MIAGATEHALTSRYITAISTVPSKQDPIASRRAKNEALLASGLTVPDYVLGVDGCRSGWLVCRYEVPTQRLSFDVQATFQGMLAAASDARHIAIDIPIGLTEDGRARRCDIDARRLLGKPRSSSVFPAPARRLLNASSYREACQISRGLRGRAISQQAFGILRKVAEVDRVMRPELQKRIFEVHLLELQSISDAASQKNCGRL